MLGIGLAHLYQAQSNRRALDQAASEADAIANAGIEPVLAGRALTDSLTPAERAGLSATTRPLLQSGNVLRLRLRDRTGIVVFDAAHPDQPPHGEHDDEVETAAAGHVVRKLTRVNRDEVDATSAIGARA